MPLDTDRTSVGPTQLSMLQTQQKWSFSHYFAGKYNAKKVRKDSLRLLSLVAYIIYCGMYLKGA